MSKQQPETVLGRQHLRRLHLVLDLHAMGYYDAKTHEQEGHRTHKRFTNPLSKQYKHKREEIIEQELDQEVKHYVGR